MKRLAVLGILLGLESNSACSVKKVAADINPTQVAFWDNYVGGDDTALANAVTQFDALPTIASVKGTTTMLGAIGDALGVQLQASDLATVMLQGVNNPSTAIGLIAVTEMPCTLDQLEPYLYSLSQKQIHTGDYMTYNRSYTSDLTAYTSRTSETLTWTSTYTPDDVSYNATVNGGLRRIPDLGPTVTPFGPIVLSRTWMPAPSSLTGGGQEFNQDYQIEIYYERTPGHVVHSFTDWRDIKVDYGGILVSSSDSIYQSIITSNDLTWDQDTAMLCGKPAPP